SDGIHANGMTLARRVLLADGAASASHRHDDLGMTVGEELLRPTHIYVPEILALLAAGVDVHGLAHISGDGLLNLTRLQAAVSYRIDAMPEIQPVFRLIQEQGNVELAEMFRVFNMGVGFCVVVPEGDAAAAIAAVRAVGGEITAIGAVVPGAERRVEVPQHGLVGRDGRFGPM
ncbi:MAG: AIR synthase-related protein, partial [Dehalococcoidia bacterium]